MAETNETYSYIQASSTWKFIAFVVMVPAIFLGVYGSARFLIATFILAEWTGESLYQLFCLPISIFSTPFVTLALPYFLVRDATETTLRRYMVGAGVLLVIAVGLVARAPELSMVLWGIGL